jgi:alpha-tubulin suppressor-like RCC1 family protein
VLRPFALLGVFLVAACASKAQDAPCVVGERCGPPGIDPAISACFGVAGTDNGQPICACECSTPPAGDAAVSAFGDAGDGSTFVATPIHVPVDDAGIVPSGLSIAPGLFFTCVRGAAGGVTCWGYDMYGMLGDNLELDQVDAGPVMGLNGSLALSVGGYNACIIAPDHTVWCWGDNFGGQLGQLSLATSPVPVQVPGVNDVVQLAVGLSDSDCVLHSTGTAECWGSNVGGALGNGSLYGTPYFQDAPEPVFRLEGAVAITVGDDHGCALLQDGTVTCWGAVLYANEGTDASTSQPAPLAVQGLSDVKTIAAGDGFTCALKNDGTVWCWGDNGHGELGLGTTGKSLSIPAQVPGLSGVASISAGDSYACAVLASQTAVCWGDNEDGNLGNGTTALSAAPVPVMGLTNVTGIAAGSTHTCAQVADGSFYCWGNNQSGQLGDGTTLSSSVPVKVTAL